MKQKAVSIFETLVTLVIIAVWMALVSPLLIKVKSHQRDTANMNNQRGIVIAATMFSNENDNRYPCSIATIGTGEKWGWQEPTMMVSQKRRASNGFRSISGLLGSYISEPDMMFCPNAPNKYKHLKQMWKTGDEWNNPETSKQSDAMMGTYCFWWGYKGVLEKSKEIFNGPQSSSAKESTVLVSDYFGFGHWRNKKIYGDYKAYGSCEKIPNAQITDGTEISSDFWSLHDKERKIEPQDIKIKLVAGFTDGHVEKYGTENLIGVKVATDSQCTNTYPDGTGPGVFYLPDNTISN